MTAPPDYSYFRAEGLALEAVMDVLRETTALAEYKLALCQSYGAIAVIAGTLEVGSGDFVLRGFIFNSEQQVPDGWVIAQRLGGRPYATPDNNPKDALDIANICGLMERSSRRVYLEYHFGSGKMPKRFLPAGDYSTAFVCYSKLEQDIADAPYPRAFMRDHYSVTHGSSTPQAIDEHIDYMKLDGAWYIRVPNDAAGNALFTPPDGTLMSFADMIIADRNEYSARHPRSPAPGMA